MAATSFVVVVTNYNYGRFVQAAVDSALAQTRPAERIIVVDDGSTDGSIDLLRKTYGENPLVDLHFVPNGGQLSAFIQGVAHAKSDVVCFLDADDEWRPDYIARIGALYDARNDVDFVMSDMELFGDATGTEAFAEREEDLGPTAILTYFAGFWYGAPTSALSMRRRWAVESLDLPGHFLPRWRICADNCLVYGPGILGARKYYLPTSAVRYRIHGNNGYYNKRTPLFDYTLKLNKQCLINHYAAKIGLDRNCLHLAKAELQAKPAPSDAERKRYTKLIVGKSSWYKKLRQRWSLYRRGLLRRQS